MVITVVVALVIFLFACNPPQLLASLITYATCGLTVAFFHTVLLGLFWKRANEYGAVAGILSGIALYLFILAYALGVCYTKVITNRGYGRERDALV